MNRLPRLKRAAMASLATFGLSATVTIACGDGEDGDSCVSTREYFADRGLDQGDGQVKCITCHGPAGIAEEGGAEFNLLPSSYPGFMDANFESRHRRTPSSPTTTSPPCSPSRAAQTKHGGGEVIKPDSEEYRIIESLRRPARRPQVECGDGDVTELDGVVALTPEETLRKASLHLVGRLPTAEERRRSPTAARMPSPTPCAACSTRTPSTTASATSSTTSC
jgi:hypothetical protein